MLKFYKTEEIRPALNGNPMESKFRTSITECSNPVIVRFKDYEEYCFARLVATTVNRKRVLVWEVSDYSDFVEYFEIAEWSFFEGALEEADYEDGTSLVQMLKNISQIVRLCERIVATTSPNCSPISPEAKLLRRIRMIEAESKKSINITKK